MQAIVKTVVHKVDAERPQPPRAVRLQPPKAERLQLPLATYKHHTSKQTNSTLGFCGYALKLFNVMALDCVVLFRLPVQWPSWHVEHVRF